MLREEEAYSRNETLRESVISYCVKYFNKQGQVPTTRNIIKNVNGVNSTTKLYELFPGKMAEICRDSGLPEPTERLESTRKATREKVDGIRRESKDHDSLMRLLGEPDPKKALSLSVKIVADHASYAAIYGLKNASELVDYFYNQHDEDMDKIIGQAGEIEFLRENYYWETEEELRDVLGVPDGIWNSYRRWKRNYARHRQDENLLLSYIFTNLLSLMRDARRRIREEAQPSRIF